MSDLTVSRSLHDLGAAAWFGGALMGPIALTDAATATEGEDGDVDARDRGWQAWQPWKTAAIAAHVVGSLGLLWDNKARLAGQHGAMTVNVAKTGVFAGALTADLLAAKLGRSYAQARRDGQETSSTALRAAQWATAALTGANVVLGARMGEQQRPSQVLRGAVDRLRPDR